MLPPLLTHNHQPLMLLMMMMLMNTRWKNDMCNINLFCKTPSTPFNRNGRKSNRKIRRRTKLISLTTATTTARKKNVYVKVEAHKKKLGGETK